MADRPTRKSRKERSNEAIATFRSMTSNLQAVKRTDDIGEVLDILDEDIKQSDNLYPHVRKNLDGTVADAKHIRELFNVCQEVSKRIRVSTKSFELKVVLQKLLREHKSVDNLYTHVVNNHFGPSFRTAPSYEFSEDSCPEIPNSSAGLSATPATVRKERMKRVKVVPTESENTVTAKEKNMDVEEKDLTSIQVELVEKELSKLTRNKPVNFYQALVDPDSFSGTVENIFHTSFLLKEGKISIKRDGDKPILTSEADEGEDNQSILSFTMRDYRNWISSHNINKPAWDRRQSTDR